MMPSSNPSGPSSQQYWQQGPQHYQSAAGQQMHMQEQMAYVTQNQEIHFSAQSYPTSQQLPPAPPSAAPSSIATPSSQVVYTLAWT